MNAVNHIIENMFLAIFHFSDFELELQVLQELCLVKV